MSSNNELPLGLYRANLDLQLRIGKLVQESSQQWLQLGKRLLGGGTFEDSAHKLEELLEPGNWPKLAALPAEAFWQQLQRRLGDSQAVVRIAVDAQSAFAHGLQDALRTWQQETATVLDDSRAGLSWDDSAWAQLFKPWEPLPARPAAPAPAARARPAPAAKAAAKKKATAPRKPAGKRSTGKKAAKRTTPRK